ncbi:MAG: alkyl sulfatase dimerization domain-containing protein [Pseudomonadota bacterium]|nr:alkyl sulfatase dimerization domain-containing protein [Pseudomonadota bacterium]
MSYKPLPEHLRAAKPASKHTLAAQERMRKHLDFSDRQSFENARKGFIATLDPMTIKRDDGHITFDLAHMSFLDSEAPDTVNPSLWRQAQLNAQHHGLFEVCDGLYQVRSFDIANMTLIRGNSGWIVIDPLTSSESSAAALALANQELGERPVVAVIHTHSHADHFAGVLGVINHEDAASGKVAVIAPKEFVNESLNENVLAGNAMARRSTYMYGNLLRPSATGYVTTGLGAALSMGTTGFIVPNDLVHETGETRLIDGIEFEFQMTMGTEAPSEFVFYLPQFKALCMSEITSHHLHNVYTPRGAQVRDALAWAAQINESIDLFGDRLEIQFASHHWPIWGRAAAIEYLEKQRDLYKFIHDQTLRLANKGYNKEEIAERVTLPDSLSKEFFNRDYYGTVHHNSRAVYVKYLGFFDGNPANLYQLPPTEQAVRYLDYMGGADAIVTKAQSSFADGDYRWVAEVLNHVVMADSEHVNARALLADTYEQLGYQSESAPWRNFYLCGALELREGLPESRSYAASAGMAAGIPIENLFQIMAVRLLPEAASEDMRLHLQFSDLDKEYLLQIKHSVLNSFVCASDIEADARLTLSSIHFKQLFMGLITAAELIEQQQLTVEGDVNALLRLGSMFDQFPRRYPLVTPRQQ